VGPLNCNVASGWGFVLGSYQDADCTYEPRPGVVERYAGKIGKAGVDLGYHAETVIGWFVVAPTQNVEPGALAGTYVGATGSAAVGVGIGANALFGGGRSVALQPVSLQASTGFNVAAGVAWLKLEPVASALAPLPPRPAAAPPESNFVVYFATNSSTLSPTARDIVQQSAAAAKQQHSVRISVTGHTDTVGKSPYNQRLSERRAAAVRTELINWGIPANQIDATGVGEADLAVPTAQGINEPRNRRVVITESGPGT
jgi:outer membrane protein OmpA-like peptidoglycan-associated protein